MGTILHKQIIIKTIENIENNTELFYQQKNKEGYEMLESTISQLLQIANEIISSATEKEDSHKEGQKFNEVLLNAMEAIERRDTILLSDILYFDLKPLLDKSISDI